MAQNWVPNTVKLVVLKRYLSATYFTYFRPAYFIRYRVPSLDYFTDANVVKLYRHRLEIKQDCQNYIHRINLHPPKIPQALIPDKLTFVTEQ